MTRAALVNCRTNVLIMVGQLFLPQKGRDLGMCIRGRGQGSFRPKADIEEGRLLGRIAARMAHPIKDARPGRGTPM